MNQLDYGKIKVQGVTYGAHNRLAVLVHPLWTRYDLGQDVVDFWKGYLEDIAKDENYALVLTQPDMPNPSSSSEERWRKRVDPIIALLPQQFGNRYLRWPHGNFIRAREPLHIETLKEILKNQFTKYG